MGVGILKISKLLSIIVICCVFLTTLNIETNSAAAKKNLVSPSEERNVKLTNLIVGDTYSKIKVEYLETGELEYIESKLENGEYVYYVSSDNGKIKHKIESIGEDIVLNGEVISTVSQPNKGIKTDVIAPMENNITSTKWLYTSTSYGNSSWRVVNGTIVFSTIVAIVASILKIPAGYPIVGEIAWTFKANDLTHTYYAKSHYKDYYSNYTTCRTAANTSFYRYSNYTGFIQASGLISDSLDLCAQPY